MISKNIVLVIILCFLYVLSHSGAASAQNVVTEMTLTAGGSGVTSGTFDADDDTLTNTGGLTHANANQFTRNYISQRFTPSATAQYDFGISQSPNDTVLIVYSKPFNPLDPDDGAIALDDDNSSNTVPPGVTIVGCTTASLCPQISNLLLNANQTYYIVITTYRDHDTATPDLQPVDFPQTFYVYGPSVVIGVLNATEANTEYATDVSSNFSHEVGTSLEGLVTFESGFADFVRAGHIASSNSENLQFLSKSRNNAQTTMQIGNQKYSFSGGITADDHSFKLDEKIVVDTKLSKLGSRLIVMSDVQIHKYKGRSSEHTGRLKVAYQTEDGNGLTTGVAAGIGSGRTKFSRGLKGEVKQKNFSLSMYAISSIDTNLVLDGFVTVSKAEYEMDVANSEMSLTSDFDNSSIVAGINLTGYTPLNFDQLDKETRVELQPNASFVLGTTSKQDALSKVITAVDEKQIIQTVNSQQLLKVTVSPQLTYQSKKSGSFFGDDIITISPKLICEKYEDSSRKDACGYGLGLQLTKPKGNESMIKLSYESIGIRDSGSLIFEYRLAF